MFQMHMEVPHQIDRQIVERSNLPAMCESHDSVMAHKGFNVQDLFAPYDVTINIPTFFRKKSNDWQTSYA